MPVNSVIDSFSKIANLFDQGRRLRLAEEDAEQSRAWRAEQMGMIRAENTRKQKQWADEDALREAQGLQAKMEAGTATAEEETRAYEVAGVERGTKGLPLAGTLSAQGLSTQTAQRMTQSDATLTMRDDIHRLKRRADEAGRARYNTVLGALDKVDKAKETGQAPVLDDAESNELVRMVVNSDTFSDDDIGGQYRALQTIQDYFKNTPMQAIQGRTVVDDPVLMEAIGKAYPKLTAKSNLQGARVSALYLDPSPDGDPMNMKTMVGIAGTDAEGRPVDGVLTRGRTSDPNDEVMVMPAGVWLTQAEVKRKALDGLQAVRVGLGDAEARKRVETMRENKSVANRLTQFAAQMPEGRQRQQVEMTAQLLMNGDIDLPKAEKMVEMVYPKKELTQIDPTKDVYSDGKLVKEGERQKKQLSKFEEGVPGRPGWVRERVKYDDGTEDVGEAFPKHKPGAADGGAGEKKLMSDALERRKRALTAYNEILRSAGKEIIGPDGSKRQITSGDLARAKEELDLANDEVKRFGGGGIKYAEPKSVTLTPNAQTLRAEYERRRTDDPEKAEEYLASMRRQGYGEQYLRYVKGELDGNTIVEFDAGGGQSASRASAPQKQAPARQGVVAATQKQKAATGKPKTAAEYLAKIKR